MLDSLAVEAHAVYAGTELVDLPQPSCLAHIDSGFTQQKVNALVALRQGHRINTGGEIFAGGGRQRGEWIHEVVEHGKSRNIFVNFGRSPDCVRRVLLAAADPGQDVGPEMRGAGVVSHESVRALLEGMTPAKFLELFVDDGRWDALRAISASRLDGSVGPLWTPGHLDVLEQLYAHQFEDLFIEVGSPGASGHGDTMVEVQAAPMRFAKEPVYVDIDEHGTVTVKDADRDGPKPGPV